jgi:hypothetical protein
MRRMDTPRAHMLAALHLRIAWSRAAGQPTVINEATTLTYLVSTTAMTS